MARTPGCGQQHVEGGGLRRVRRSPELPAVHLDDRAADREAEAETVLLGGEERLEEPARRALWNAAARVPHDQLDTAAVARRGLDGHLARHCLAVGDRLE